MEPKFYPEDEPVREHVAMISQPMNGRTDEEIEAVRKEAMAKLIADGYSVINTFFTGDYYIDPDALKEEHGIVNPPIFYLAASIHAMSQCDAVYFVKGWESARGCVVEHGIAERYGLRVIEE